MQLFAIFERYMLTCRVLIDFGEAKVDEKQSVHRVGADAHQEVLWLDVLVEDASLMHLFDQSDHLHSDVQVRLKIETTSAVSETFFQIFAEQVHNHDELLLISASQSLTNKVNSRDFGLAT